MRIDLTSELGRRVRVIDDDTGRADPPRGAIAVIETSRKKRQWIVPVDAAGHYRGRSRDDRRHERLRKEAGAENIQLVDHRTGKPRAVQVLVSKRSKNFALAQEFAAEFARLSDGK